MRDARELRRRLDAGLLASVENDVDQEWNDVTNELSLLVDVALAAEAVWRVQRHGPALLPSGKLRKLEDALWGAVGRAVDAGLLYDGLTEDI